MRIIYFGNRCPFSAPPLAALIEADYPPVAIVIPGPAGGPALTRTRSSGNTHFGRPLPMAEISTIDRLAMTAAAEMLTISNLNDSQALGAIEALQPDLFIAACFPRKLPAALLALPAGGAYNIHPSLLPRWRGPDPLFWTFQAGDQETGVSIHQMTTSFDAGPIAAQRAIPMPAETTLPQLELLLATVGAAMMVDLLEALENGPINSWPQQKTGVTYAPLPHDADWIAAPGWTVRRALQFIQGVAANATPVTVTSTQGNQFQVSGATYAGSPGGQTAPTGHIYAEFLDGCLLAKVAAGGW